MNDIIRLRIQANLLILRFTPRNKADMVKSVRIHLPELEEQLIYAEIDKLTQQKFFKVVSSGELDITDDGVVFGVVVENIANLGNRALLLLQEIQKSQSLSMLELEERALAVVGDGKEAAKCINEFLRQEIIKITFEDELRVVMAKQGNILLSL